MLASCDVLGLAPAMGALYAALDAINEEVILVRAALGDPTDPTALAVHVDPQSGLPEHIVTMATRLRFDVSVTRGAMFYVTRGSYALPCKLPPGPFFTCFLLRMYQVHPVRVPCAPRTCAKVAAVVVFDGHLESPAASSYARP